MFDLRRIFWIVLLCACWFTSQAQDTTMQTLPDMDTTIAVSPPDSVLRTPEYPADEDSTSLSNGEKSKSTRKTNKPSNDTTALKTKPHSPKLAGAFSAALPGLGQGYNRKYWKIPIVYAGFGGIGVAIFYFGQKFVFYRDEYRFRLNHDDTLTNRFADQPTANVLFNKEYHQRNMEYAILGALIWYLLNVVDAVVDAHLMNFDVSDNLSLTIVPFVKPNTSPLALNTRTPFNVTFILRF